MKTMKVLALLGVVLVTAAIFAQDASTYYNVVRGNQIFLDKVETAGTLTAAGAVAAESTLAVTGVSTLTGGFIVDGERVLTRGAASVTSPTVTFSVDGENYVTLNSDANQTGFYPTGGTVGQVVTIISGAGSNTMRFDDGTSMTIGGNITLTEAQNDVLTLVCTSADGDEWAAVSAHDN